MIYTLLIVACLAGAPPNSPEADCRRYEQPAYGLPGNPSAAFLEAQARVAAWAAARPRLRVRAWRLVAGRLT